MDVLATNHSITADPSLLDLQLCHSEDNATVVFNVTVAGEALSTDNISYPDSCVKLSDVYTEAPLTATFECTVGIDTAHLAFSTEEHGERGVHRAQVPKVVRN